MSFFNPIRREEEAAEEEEEEEEEEGEGRHHRCQPTGSVFSQPPNLGL